MHVWVRGCVCYAACVAGSPWALLTVCVCRSCAHAHVRFLNVHLCRLWLAVCRSEAPAAIGNYARYSLRRLEGILNSGPSGFVPSVDEIQAYVQTTPPPSPTPPHRQL
jgi:hypothetical protein